MTNTVSFDVIGRVYSPYKEKFAIPRQPGIISAAKGTIELINKANNEELLRGIEQFSHLWLLFVFHGTEQQGWKPLVRPPRLGGNKKLGVLATRSTFRPNPIGMSVVKLDGVEQKKQQMLIHISGLDLLDQTPIIDIKPYIPYSDAIVDAQAGFANESPSTRLSVMFSEQARLHLQSFSQKTPELGEFITQVLEQDPRPAYKQNKLDEKIYGMNLYDLNIQWQLTSNNTVVVLAISEVKHSPEQAGNLNV